MPTDPNFDFLDGACALANEILRRGGDYQLNAALALVVFAVTLAGDDVEVRRQLGLLMHRYVQELLPNLGCETGRA